MIFEEIAKDTVERVYGAIASIIMGRDGIALSQYLKEGVDIDLETIGIEYANLLSEISKVTESIGSGVTQEVNILTDNYLILLRSISPEYFIALVLSPDGNFGKGRYLLRVSVPKIKAEL